VKVLVQRYKINATTNNRFNTSGGSIWVWNQSSDNSTLYFKAQLVFAKVKEPPNIGKNSVLKIVINLEPILAKTKMMGELFSQPRRRVS
jgi:hypothetical protein